MFADLKLALRSFAKAPGATVAIVATLMLGIGTSGAMWSVLDAVLLEPLDYPAPQRLVLVTSQFPTLNFDRFWVSPPEYKELREWSRSYQALGAYRLFDANLAGASEPLRVRTAVASASLFDALAVAPRLGRVFTEAEDRRDGPKVAVMSHELHARAFGSDPGVIGRSLVIDGEPTTIVGVMPPGFDVEDGGAELWVPLALPENPQNRGNHFLYLVGRLRPDTTVAAARAELSTLVRGWRERVPEGHVPGEPNHRLQLRPLHDEVVGSSRPVLLALLGAVGFVLLIACANVANILLARAEARQREMALRGALGATRGRLVRQVLTESTLLALAGGALGVLLAQAGVRVLLRASPGSLPRADSVELDGSVLGVALVVALATGLLFGLAPALRLASGRVGQLLKEGGQRTAGSRGAFASRAVLVVAEIALALTLVVGAGLLLRTLGALLRQEAGWQPRELVAFEIDLPRSAYPAGAEQAGFHRRLLQNLEAIPGVTGVALACGLPPLREVDANDTQIEGWEEGPDAPPQNMDYYQCASPGYLEVMNIRLVEGRGIAPSDDGAAPPVVLVNRHTAETYWPGESALGKRLRPGFDQEIPWFTVVGVVEDVKQGGLDAEVGTELYFSYFQAAERLDLGPSLLSVVVRSPQPLASLGPEIQRTVRTLDPSLPVADLRTMTDRVERSVSRPRLAAFLISVFGALALGMAAIGVYGVLSYAVAQRTREIGIRMALGAERRAILRAVVGQGLLLAAIGVVVGGALAAGLARAVRSLLWGVQPGDPLSYGAAICILLLVATVSCLVPALRATRVDPLRALRHE